MNTLTLGLIFLIPRRLWVWVLFFVLVALFWVFGIFLLLFFVWWSLSLKVVILNCPHCNSISETCSSCDSCNFHKHSLQWGCQQQHCFLTFCLQGQIKMQAPLRKSFAEMTSLFLHAKQTHTVDYKGKYNWSCLANNIWSRPDCIPLAWSRLNMNLVCLYHTALIFPESAAQWQYCYQIIQNEQLICGKPHLQTRLLNCPIPSKWGNIYYLYLLRK